MRPTRTLIGQRVLTAGIVCLALTAGARAGGFVFTTVLNDETPIDGNLTFEGTAQVVAGNGGVVATSSFFNDDSLSAITYNGTNGSSATQIIARDDNLGGSGKTLHDYDPSSSASFSNGFSELSLSQAGQTKITFLAQDSNLDFGLFQANLDVNTYTTIQHLSDYTLQTDVNDQELANIHQQVNDAGQVVYGLRHLSDDQQAIGLSGGVFISEQNLLQGNLQDFNETANSGLYKRLAIAADGSVVFRATNATDGTIGIYRSSNLNLPIVGGLPTGVPGALSDLAVVIGASNTSVLYTDVDSSLTTTTLTLATATGRTAIVSYAAGAFYAHNAVMTQGDRVAFYAPVDPAHQTAEVGYYRAGSGADGATIIATDGVTKINDNGREYTVSQISTVDGVRNTIPMVNDKGTVVFDADLSTSGSAPVQALIVWQESTGTAQVVVKTNDGTDTDDDANYNGHPITAIAVDSGTDQAGDVLKDGLSDDNWLAFGITYDIDGVDHQAVIETFIPEPTSMSVTLAIGAGSMLRRRRRDSLNGR